MIPTVCPTLLPSVLNDGGAPRCFGGEQLGLDVLNPTVPFLSCHENSDGWEELTPQILEKHACLCSVVLRSLPVNKCRAKWRIVTVQRNQRDACLFLCVTLGLHFPSFVDLMFVCLF